MKKQLESNEPFSEKFIQKIHTLVEGQKKTIPYRDSQNAIYDSSDGALVYLPLEAKDVTFLMADLVKWVKDNLQTLLDNGADVNAHDSSGNTVLMYACKFNANENVIKMLINYGANVNARDNDWKSVLMYASQNDNIEILKILIQAGANVNAKTEDGTTALIIAAQNNPNVNVIKFLLENGADINVRVVPKAVQIINTTTKNIRKKQKAIKATTNINVKNITNKALSWYAGTKGIFMASDGVEQIYDGVEQIYQNVIGKNVLMVASENPNPQIIDLLLKYKVNVNETGPFGMTALMYACDSKTSSDVSGIKMLLEHGANTKIVNEYGETALDYLKDNGVKKENSEYWDVLELYHQISESDNDPKEQIKGNKVDNNENTFNSDISSKPVIDEIDDF